MKTSFKKNVLCFALFAAFAMIFTGCNKEKEKENNQEPIPSTMTLYYTVTNEADGHTAADCFHYNISYTDADGSTVTVEDAQMPWTKSIKVPTSFVAKLEGTITYDEADMPDYVCFIKAYQISPSPNAELERHHTHGTKEHMLQAFHDHPENLTFTRNYPPLGH